MNPHLSHRQELTLPSDPLEWDLIYDDPQFGQTSSTTINKPSLYDPLVISPDDIWVLLVKIHPIEKLGS